MSVPDVQISQPWRAERGQEESRQLNYTDLLTSSHVFRDCEELTSPWNTMSLLVTRSAPLIFTADTHHLCLTKVKSNDRKCLFWIRTCSAPGLEVVWAFPPFFNLHVVSQTDREVSWILHMFPIYKQTCTLQTCSATVIWEQLTKNDYFHLERCLRGDIRCIQRRCSLSALSVLELLFSSEPVTLGGDLLSHHVSDSISRLHDVWH